MLRSLWGGTRTERFANPSEAAFAALLDAFAIEWRYEPHTLIIERRGELPLAAFAPDFYLPRFSRYVELTTLRQRWVTVKHRKLRRARAACPWLRVTLLYRRDLAEILAGPRPAEPLPPGSVDRAAAEVVSRWRPAVPWLIGLGESGDALRARLGRALEMPSSSVLLERCGGAARPQIAPVPPAGADLLLCCGTLDTGLACHLALRACWRTAPRSVRVIAPRERERRRLVDLPLLVRPWEVAGERRGEGIVAGLAVAAG